MPGAELHSGPQAVISPLGDASQQPHIARSNTTVTVIASEPRRVTTLNVIVNGFHLHHGMVTSYKYSGESLKRDHPELRELLDEYFPS